MPLVPSFFETKGKGGFNLLNLSLTLENEELRFDPEEWRDHTEELRLDKWLNATAYFHELRHYHDLVGTVCGYHFLLEATALVDQFYEALRRENRTVARAPLLTHKSDLRATQIYSRYLDFLRVVLGDISIPSTIEWSTDYPVRQFISEQPQLTTSYPLIPVPLRDPYSGDINERLLPVGLRSLMEHSATEMQVFIVAIAAGEDPHDLIDAEGRVRRSSNMWTTLFRSGFLPYVTVHLFSSYALHVTSGLESPTFASMTPPIGEVSSIVQAALDISGYAAFPDRSGYRWDFEHPGLAFGHLLATWAREKPRGDLVSMVNRLESLSGNLLRS